MMELRKLELQSTTPQLNSPKSDEQGSSIPVHMTKSGMDGVVTSV